jgi:hypothetical protein
MRLIWIQWVEGVEPMGALVAIELVQNVVLHRWTLLLHGSQANANLDQFLDT